MLRPRRIFNSYDIIRSIGKSEQVMYSQSSPANQRVIIPVKQLQRSICRTCNTNNARKSHTNHCKTEDMIFHFILNHLFLFSLQHYLVYNSSDIAVACIWYCIYFDIIILFIVSNKFWSIFHLLLFINDTLFYTHWTL